MEFIELTTNEYRDFASHHPYYNFLNSVESFETRSTSGWKHVFVGVKENNQIIAATGIMFVPVMKKFFYAYAQRGFLIDYHNEELLSFFTSNLKKYLKDKKVLYITADPYVLYQERNLDGDIVTDGFNNHYVIENMQKVGFVHQGFTTGFDPRSQVRFMMTLNLKDKDTHQILKEMDQQTRWSVNKTIKLGVKVREINLDELDVFEDVMAYTSKKKNIQNMGKSYYERQYKAFGKDNFKLIISYLDLDEFKETVAKDRIREEATLNEIEAALIETPNSKKFLKKKKVQLEALELITKREQEIQEFNQKYDKEVVMAVASFVFCGDEVIYLTSGSYDEFRKYNAPYAIQWYMIQESLKRGITRYNFYGTSGIFDKSADDYGVYEFKKGFNAIPEELVGEFILPVHGFLYKLYRLITKIKK